MRHANCKSYIYFVTISNLNYIKIIAGIWNKLHNVHTNNQTWFEHQLQTDIGLQLQYNIIKHFSNLTRSARGEYVRHLRPAWFQTQNYPRGCLFPVNKSTYSRQTPTLCHVITALDLIVIITKKDWLDLLTPYPINP